ncbi:hypothetical protein PUR56_18330 [Streptomyces sp. BE303]|nr:hypothetical protein [Streptomyces sp. BE303]
MEEQEWVSTERGSHLRGRVTRNTRPEVSLRKAVHALGLRFRLHRTVAPRCTPDFVLSCPVGTRSVRGRLLLARLPTTRGPRAPRAQRTVLERQDHGQPGTGQPQRPGRAGRRLACHPYLGV